MKKPASVLLLPFVLLAAACAERARSGPSTDCRCEGAVPEGTLSVACDDMQCVGGTAGYLCTGPGTAVAAPEACMATGDGGMPTADAGPTATDAGPADAGPRPPEWTVFLEDPALGLVRDIHATSGRDVWFVTGSGQVVRWTGGTTTDVWDFGVELFGVYGTGPSDVWVVGEDGVVANYDGDAGFDPLSSRPTSGPLYDTWGDAETRYVAGELWGDLKHADAPFDVYTTFEVRDGLGNRLSGDTLCVTGNSVGLWVCGEDGLYGYDGEWHTILSDARPIRAMHVGRSRALALEERSVWYVTFRDSALSGAFGGHSLPIPPGVDTTGGPRLRGLWGDGTEAWVVGTDGYVAHITGYTSHTASWRRVDVGTTADLESITADAESIWIGGEDLILRRDR